MTINNLQAGNIAFHFYDAANGYLYEKPSTLAFVSNGTAGSVMEPYTVNLEPLSVSIDPQGIISTTILDTSWVGHQRVEVVSIDCNNPLIDRDTVIANFIIDPNTTGDPLFFSADSLSFTETSCLDLYDANAFDQINDEGNGLLYRIVGGADQGRFGIDSSNGQLYWQEKPDFEVPVDANSDNVYELVLEVADADQKTDQLSLKITVLDAPMESFSASIQSYGFLCDPVKETTLTGSSGLYYQWNTGEKTSEITVNQTGLYTLEITNALGCDYLDARYM